MKDYGLMADDDKVKAIPRGDFLKKMTTVGAALTYLYCGKSKDGLTIMELAALDAASKNNPTVVTVYRLSTRGIRSCNACVKHAQFKVFTTYDAADQNRAHVGCNCPVVEQFIPVANFNNINHQAVNGVIDLRYV